MKPDYELESIRLYNCDCMDFMKDIPNKYYELAIVDSPYGIGINQMNMGSRQTVILSKKKWDDIVPDDNYFDELLRISKNQMIWGGNYFKLSPTRGFIIWDKGETMYGRSFAECEFCWTSFDMSARIIKLSPNQLQRIHPTQKPVQLYKWLLTNYAKKGDKIFDSHGGSFSSACACLDMGFEFDGCELDKDYFKAAVKRVYNHQQLYLDFGSE